MIAMLSRFRLQRFLKNAKHHVWYKLERALTGKKRQVDAHQSNMSDLKYEEAYLSLKHTAI